jgi:hypothetical protein
MTSFSDYEPAFAEMLGYRTKVGLYVGDAISNVLYSKEHVKKNRNQHMDCTQAVGSWLLGAARGWLLTLQRS